MYSNLHSFSIKLSGFIIILLYFDLVNNLYRVSHKCLHFTLASPSGGLPKGYIESPIDKFLTLVWFLFDNFG